MDNKIEQPSNQIVSSGYLFRKFNQDLFLKTTLALQTINRYEIRSKPVSYSFQMPKMRTKFSQDNYSIHTNLRSGIQQNINLIGSNMEYYKLECTQDNLPLRIHFKNVKNATVVYCSFSENYPSPEKFDYKILVERDFRRIITKKNQHQISYLYLALKSNSHLSNLTFKLTYNTLRYQTLQSEVTPIKNRELHDHSLKTQQSRHILPRESLTTRKNQSLQKSINNQVNYSNNKTMEKTQSLTKLSKKQILNRKLIIAKARKQQLQTFKSKERLLSQMIIRSREHILMKQQQIQKQRKQEQQMIKKMSVFLKFFHLSVFIDQKKDKYCQKLRNDFIEINHEAHFKKIMKSNLLQIRKFIDNKKDRDHTTIRSSLCILGNIIKKKCDKQSKVIVTSTFNNIYIAQKVNNSFQQATLFRRNLRFIQKFWKFKYHARFNAIKRFAIKSVNKLGESFSQFKNLIPEFLNGNRLDLLIVEYIKQIAEKFSKMYMQYLQCLKQLNQMKEINNKIKEKNKQLSKKKQKQTLQIIDISKPYYRFYRDLDILESKIRDWFELEYKKIQKRNKKK